MTAYVVYAFKEPKGSSSVEYESLGRYVCEDRNRAVDLWRDNDWSRCTRLLVWDILCRVVRSDAHREARC